MYPWFYTLLAPLLNIYVNKFTIEIRERNTCKVMLLELQCLPLKVKGCSRYVFPRGTRKVGDGAEESQAASQACLNI